MKPQNKKLSTTSTSLPKAKPLAPVKTKRNLKPALIALVAVLLLGGVLSAWHWRSGEIRLEKAYQADKTRFMQVEKDMATAYTNMVAGDKPLHEESYKNCEYPSIEFSFSKGNPSCKVGFAFEYGSDDGLIGSRIKNFAVRLSSSDYQLTATAQSTLETINTYGQESSVSLDVLKTQKDYPRCSLTESVYKKNKFTSSRIAAPYVHLFNFRCSESMKRPIYDVLE